MLSPRGISNGKGHTSQNEKTETVPRWLFWFALNSLPLCMFENVHNKKESQRKMMSLEAWQIFTIL